MVEGCHNAWPRPHRVRKPSCCGTPSRVPLLTLLPYAPPPLPETMMACFTQFGNVLNVAVMRRDGG